MRKPAIKSSLNANAVAQGVWVGIILAQASQYTNNVAEAIEFCLSAAREAENNALTNPPMKPLGTVGRLLMSLGELEEEAAKGKTDLRYEAESPQAKEAALHAAAFAYRICMPQLTSRRNTQAYIACVAVAVQYGYFTGKDASALLYTAQLALSAHPKRRSHGGRKA